MLRGLHKGPSLWTDGQGETQDSSEEEQGAEGEREAEEAQEEEEDRILAASLAFVPQHGWTTEAIAEGARSLGLSGTVHGIFPGGGYDIISFFENQCNEKLTSHLRQLSDPQGERSVWTLRAPAIPVLQLLCAVMLFLTRVVNYLLARLCVRHWSIA